MAGNWKNIEEQIDRARERARHGDPREKRGEKRSWRDIDAKRDGAAHGPHRDEERARPDKAKDAYAEAQAEKAALADLNELFRDKKGDARRAEILALEDRAELQAAVELWFEEKGELSADSELLDKCMDVRKDSTLRKVIASIDAAIPSLDEHARQMLLRKAQTKGRRSFDKKLSKDIAAMLEKHAFHDA
jgi:hypothetical protein